MLNDAAREPAGQRFRRELRHYGLDASRRNPNIHRSLRERITLLRYLYTIWTNDRDSRREWSSLHAQIGQGNDSIERHLQQ